MSRHFEADVLARAREDLVSPRKAARIRAHLSACAACAAVDAGLRRTSAVLASLPDPVIPAQVGDRLLQAIASESAARESAAAAPSPSHGRPQAPSRVPGRPDLPQRPVRARRRLRMPAPTSPLLLRGLAAAGAVVVIAGAGYFLAAHEPAGPASPSSAQGGGATTPRYYSGTQRTGTTFPGESTSRSAGFGGIVISYQRDGVQAAAVVQPSRTDYTSASLPGLVRREIASAPAYIQPSAAEPRERAQSIGGVRVSMLEACLTRISGGRSVLVAEIARYQGQPATIILLQPRRDAAGFVDVTIVGLACSATDPDILARVQVPRSASAG